jgi:hypothetical protein
MKVLWLVANGRSNAVVLLQFECRSNTHLRILTDPAAVALSWANSASGVVEPWLLLIWSLPVFLWAVALKYAGGDLFLTIRSCWSSNMNRFVNETPKVEATSGRHFAASGVLK